MHNLKAPKKKSTLIYGVATNDADYRVVNTNAEGKQVKCPFYAKWLGMLTRVYDSSLHAKRPSYANCTIHPDWLLFSNFRQWMLRQDWEGKHLDKDLLVPGNKEYGPDTCLFISDALNNLLTLRQRGRGDLPLGVSRTTINGSEYFTASCSFYGKQKRLGYFKTPEEAAQCYIKAKNAYIQELADQEQDSRVAKALRVLVLS